MHSQSQHHWNDSPLGQYLQAQETALLKEVIPNLFGYYLLQIGEGYGINTLESSRIKNKILLLNKEQTKTALVADIIFEPGMLPIASDSIDVVILPHTLELEADPHQLLREIERILIAEGVLIILGHDPYSFWGVRKALRFRQQRYPWDRHYFGHRRISDWMGLLGFDTEQILPYLFFPPLQRLVSFAFVHKFDRVCQRYLPFLGGAYLYVAKKRVSTLTPIRPQWRMKRPIVRVGLSETATRRDQCE
jgi:SAM-dependent methyltransferase